jgi:hypothetical protein
MSAEIRAPGQPLAQHIHEAVPASSFGMIALSLGVG